jgi:hypothetical protein
MCGLPCFGIELVARLILAIGEFTVCIEMGDARWRSGIPDGSISMETKSNSILPRLVIEHEEYWTNRPSPTEL